MSTRVYVGGLGPDLRSADLLTIFNRYDPLRADMKAGYAFLEFREVRDADDAIHDMDNFKLDSGKRLIVQPAKGTARTRDDFVKQGLDRGDNRDNRNNSDRYSDRDRGRGGGSGNGSGSGSRYPSSSGGSSSTGSRFPSSGFRLDVEGLDERTSWQDLKDFARKAGGNPARADVWMENGKKYGMIEYRSAEDMETALRKLDDTKLDGALVRLFPGKKNTSSSANTRSSRSRSPPPRSRSRSPRRRSRSYSSSRSRSGSRSPVRSKKSSSSSAVAGEKKKERSSRSRSVERTRERSRSPVKRARSPSPDNHTTGTTRATSSDRDRLRA